MRTAKVVFSLASIALLTSCAAGPGPSGQPTETETPKVYVTAPLTGMPFEEGTNAALNGPSVACKVDNLDVARPQINLNKTDIVFDEMVEGGLTRFVAIWHSQLPEQVGPVRSIRPMDPDIISPFGGIVCYSGGQLKFVNMMRNTNVFNASETVEQGKGTFTRASDREAPHNVIVNVNKLQAAHLDLPAPAQMFQYMTDANDANAANFAALSGVSVDLLKVYYPSALAQWEPNSDRTTWLRTQDGQPHTDAADGSRISAKNVVVLQVAIDRTYGYVPKTVMNSTGTAWVFINGKYLKATWSKAAQTAPIVLTGADGNPILLAPGNTWVELMPKAPEGKLKIVETPKATPTPSAK